MFLPLAFLSLLQTPTPLTITPEKFKQVEDQMHMAVDKAHLASLSIAILQNGKVVFAREYGMADEAKGRVANANTVYNLASLTKPFTATAILLLRDRHKLSLDDKVTKFLPEAPKAWRNITIRQLLTHSSGILDYTKFKNFEIEYGQPFTTGEVLKKAYSYPLEFAPGTRSVYSNTGFVVLGHIISRVSGMSYPAFMKQNVFKPAGMRSSFIGEIGSARKNLALGYRFEDRKFVRAPYVNPNWSFGAGAMMASLNDFCAWDRVVTGQKLLQPATWQEAWTPRVTLEGRPIRYGYGWITVMANGHRVICHFGDKPGYSAMYSYLPDDHISMVVLANRSDSNAFNISQGIFKILESK